MKSYRLQGLIQRKRRRGLQSSEARLRGSRNPAPKMSAFISSPPPPITLADVELARERITPYIKRTPVTRSKALSKRLGTNVYLKLEVFQRTGAFKVRGAFNKMLALSREERQRGVVAASGGNHAQAVACAARELDIPALVLMPESTPENYVEATKRYGATIELAENIHQAFARADFYETRGYVHVHPFDDPLVIAGQGTVGLEILEDVPEITDLFVSIGGGGLAAGVGTAIKSLRRPIRSDVRIWGVETEGADSMAQALAANRVVELPRITSIARTLGAPAVCETTLLMAQRYLESVTVVSDAEAVAALHLLMERAKIVTEPAASCTLAAAERMKDNFSPDDHVVLILCGGNLSLNDLYESEFRFR
jgi:threonine dehydratase